MAQNYNIQMTKFNGTDYDNLYPKTRISGTSGNLVSLNSSGELQDSGKKVSDFAASSHTHSNYAPTSHNHSATNITSGTLAVARGGTGITSNPSMLVNLNSTASASVFSTSPRPGITGILPVSHGGTGTTSLDTFISTLGAAKIEFGSYVGTGECGANNPTVISSEFAPDIVIIYFVIEYETQVYPRTIFFPLFPELPSTAYNYSFLYGAGNSQVVTYEGVSWSSDKKTVSFWSDYPRGQCNEYGNKYYYMTIKAK